MNNRRMPDRPRLPVRRAAARDAREIAPRTLSQEILETARALLNEQGAAALSMREVARRAQVTHQAPYHHFGDRESILAELVAQGFDELARSLSRATDRASSNGAEALAQAAGEAYVGFALANPGVFRVMFSRDLCDPKRFPGVMASGQRAHAELERLVRIVHGDGAGGEWQDLYWAHVHGLSSLLLDGPLALRFASGAQRQAHARRVTRLFAKLVATAH